ncbi:MAG: adenine deaminase [Oscillospiraceae bacterium]
MGKDIAKLVEVAAGRAQPDLVFKNSNIVNVFTGEIKPGDLAQADGYIAGVGQYSGPKDVDSTDRYLCPGFVDAHVHIESTMVLPGELVRMVLPWGTTTMIADPHEIVNVCGAKGMQFMLDASRDLPCNLYYMLPSAVPSTTFETAGAAFTEEEMRPFLSDPHVLGLGEAMQFTDVVAGRGHIMQLLEAFQGRPIDGHAPGLSGQALQAYAAAGVRSEHESTTYAEAAEKACAGIAIMVREGSAAHNLAAIVGGLVDQDMPTDQFMFCTDDKHLDDINRDGHIRWNVKLAIEAGMAPVDAIRMATLNAARHYGLHDIGAIAPGYKADIVMLSSLKQVAVERVYKDGISAAARLADVPAFCPADGEILHSVKAPELSVADLKLAVDGETDVIEMVPYQLVTRHLREAVPCENGFFVPDETYSKLCVVERHGKNGNIALAPLKGYGITGGAVATTVAHDSHNIIAAGDNDADIVLAVNHLREMGGGYVLVGAGEVIGEVPLAVGGIMSTGTAEEVQWSVGEIIQLAGEMGIPYFVDPFTSLSFMALPVIPALRLTDKGLFDVERFELIRS